MPRTLKPPIQALSPFKKGRFPKPERIKARCRRVSDLKVEFDNAENIRQQILLSDPRTGAKYYEALAHLKIAYVELEDCIDLLQNELGI